MSNQHGGRRPNQTGRPAKPPNEKRIKVTITLPPDLHQKTAGNRSAVIEHALRQYFSHQIADEYDIVKCKKCGSIDVNMNHIGGRCNDCGAKV
jgi:hypothetical protein